MANLYDTIFQEIKDRCPNINWKLGGLLRELLVEPVQVMQDAMSRYIERLTRFSDLNYALSEPTRYENVLDDWIAKLKLSAPTKREAFGEVKLITNSADTLVVPQRAIFRCGDVQLETTEAHTFTPRQFTEIIGGVFYVIVPVRVFGNVSVNIAEGAPVTWAAAPNVITDSYVHSAITGGVNSASPECKAALIKEAISDRSLAGEEAISTSLTRAFPGVVVNALHGPRNTRTALSDVPLYVKTKALPVTVTESAELIQVEEKVMRAAIPAVGVVAVEKVTSEAGVACEAKVRWDLTTSNKTLLIDIEGSELSAGDSIIVTSRKFRDIQAVSDWLNSEQRMSPFGYTCLTPAVARVSMIIDTGGVVLDVATRAALQDLICDKPLNSTITDDEIKILLTSRGYTVNKAVLYYATINHKEYTTICSSAGMLALFGQYGLQGTAVAMYSTVDDIKSC